jgi:hypothetical protein
MSGFPQSLGFSGVSDGTSCGEVLAPRQEGAPRARRVNAGRLVGFVVAGL